MPELNEIIPNIQHLSAQLETVGGELLQVASRMYHLKLELDEYREQQMEQIREKEVDGKLKLNSGEQIKLTDSVRESLARCGKRQQFAEYEALKRKREVLESAVRALLGAQSGHQSLANIVKQEMQTLNYQP